MLRIAILLRRHVLIRFNTENDRSAVATVTGRIANNSSNRQMFG
jgi:hypothetical protein